LALRGRFWPIADVGIDIGTVTISDGDGDGAGDASGGVGGCEWPLSSSIEDRAQEWLSSASVGRGGGSIFTISMAKDLGAGLASIPEASILYRYTSVLVSVSVSAIIGDNIGDNTLILTTNFLLPFLLFFIVQLQTMDFEVDLSSFTPSTTQDSTIT